jgi:hypothetical protein
VTLAVGHYFCLGIPLKSVGNVGSSSRRLDLVLGNGNSNIRENFKKKTLSKKVHTYGYY